MKPREQSNEISIPIATFIRNVEEKLRGYKKDDWESLFSFPPYLEFDNVSLNGNTLTIDKSAKPFDKVSPYKGVSGTIESTILEDDGKTILKAKIYLDTALATFIRFSMALAVGVGGLTWLILDFNVTVLIALLIIQGYIFWVIPLMQKNNLDKLNEYYDRMIQALAKE